MRRRAATRRRLTDDQKGVLGSGMGMLLLSEYGESDRETIVRIFGIFEAACEMWFAHRDELMRYDVMPGRRAPGFWVCELAMESSPDLDDQADILRERGEISVDEEQQLAAWEAMRHRPEFPTDLGIATTTIDITESPEDDDENGTNQIDRDHGAGPIRSRPDIPGEAIEGEAGEAAAAAGDQEIPVTTPRILDLPQRAARRNPHEGWESHDA